MVVYLGSGDRCPLGAQRFFRLRCEDCDLKPGGDGCRSHSATDRFTPPVAVTSLERCGAA